VQSRYCLWCSGKDTKNFPAPSATEYSSSPLISLMQNLQERMNQVLKQPYMDDSQKARQYIQLQNDFLHCKQQMNPS
jgi:hypothetical protein